MLALSSSARGLCGPGIVLLVLCLAACRSEDSPTIPAPDDSTANRSNGSSSSSPTGRPFDVAVRVAEEPTSDAPDQPLSADACPSLRDVHVEAGVEFTYVNGARGQNLMVEAMGGGAGWLDVDGDGRWDLYLCQGGDPTADPASDPAGSAESPQPADQCFRNTGRGTFEPLTEAAGLHQTGYGQGVAVGDYDQDGFDDLYLTNVGRNVLLRNQGDGTFLEVTEEAGVGDPRWSSSAAWADLDHDGDLDLYVCNYTDYDPRNPIECKDRAGQLRICHPSDVPPVADECYMNQGDGTFRPEALQRGLFGPDNRALGVAAADFTNDGLIDLYVANDTTENFLFVNQGGGTFRETATLLGCAVDHRGHRQASMGLAVGDYDQNGFLDIYSTHYYEESNTLYRNLGPRGFEDVTGVLGLHRPTYLFLGFGTVMQDLNQDGQVDLFVTNGHIDPQEKVYAMPPQLFCWQGTRWSDCSPLAGPFFEQPRVGRGVALCDYDDDGDLDLAVVHQNSPTALLRNDSRRGNWLKLQFRGTASNRRGIGVRAAVKTAERTLHQQLCGGTSYVSSHQPVLIFGLGASSDPVSVELQWPSGRTQTLRDVPVNQALVVEEPAAG